ncbi:unnamed protein product [Ranitomeya imitator]|uniref:EGF-like domain-containing protein n=1 Tax=Ranitomeya imitator TaxID=111125 RepID=A0ABN9L3D8_9NEOB|nr:unnamed protein product [Ranitomeya imitator]
MPLILQVNDQLSGSIFIPMLQVCKCANGGTCDNSVIIESYSESKYQVVGCICPDGFSGPFCLNRSKPCQGQPCFPNVACLNQNTGPQYVCSACPAATVANGIDGEKCFLYDLCLPPYPFPCHESADCVRSNNSYSCRCKLGFSGDGKNCSDINECQSLYACPNAKFECINALGSYRCSCLYKGVEDSQCGNSGNPPGWNIFNCTVNWRNTIPLKEFSTQQEKMYDALTMSCQIHSMMPHRPPTHNVDECAANEHRCSNTSMCENTYGGYKCFCNSSMELEGNDCASGKRLYCKKNLMFFCFVSFFLYSLFCEDDKTDCINLYPTPVFICVVIVM